MLLEQYLTPKQIAQRRYTTIWAVYKTIKKLRAKGFLVGSFRGGVQNTDPPFEGGVQKTDNTNKLQKLIRLHAQEFNIKILYKTPYYDKVRARKSLFYLDGNTIRLYRRSLEVYAGKKCSFYGKTAQEATSHSVDYWNLVFMKLENRLKIIIVKGENTSIRQAAAHYAETNNELAQDYYKKQQKLRIKAPEDGKTWLLIDNSFQLHELETIHPATAKADSATIQRYFIDMRDNSPPTLSQLSSIVYGAASNTAEFGKNIKSHIAAISRLADQTTILQKRVSELVKQKINK